MFALYHFWHWMHIGTECYIPIMPEIDILVVGAGIAGAAAAALLAEGGHRVTVVERAGETRSSGSPVDIRGPALDVAARLGVLDQLRAADTGVRRVEFVDRDGRVSAAAQLRATDSPDIEIARAELGRILVERLPGRVELVMGQTPVKISHDPHGVDVTFSGMPDRRFHLVIGADGQHSTTRKLVWGDEARFRSPIGLAIATAPFEVELDPELVQIHNEPRVSVALHPAGGHPGAAFIFRTELAEMPTDRTEQQRLLETRYAGVGWRGQELLDRTRSIDDLYFDGVSRVRVPHWSTGRVALLGDASSSVTILGEGSSMALVGAARLTDALSLGGEIPSALRRYEAAHRPLVERNQKGVRLGMDVLVPTTRAGIAARNLLVRIVRKV
jgi:2-polyprenyl-6-methoxyphenol hydroxylase-like FAD-dependent oxidoreductase